MAATDKKIFTAFWEIEKPARFYYLALAVFCFIVYANTIPNHYGLDDYLVTNHHPVVEKGLAGWYEIFTTNYISENGIYVDYRPLVKAGFALEFALFGWNPHWSHLINILLYAFACCLLLKLLLMLFPQQSVSILFTGMLLYAAHPVHTEVVASLKSRDELLMLIFVSLSSIAFVQFSENHSKQQFILALFFFFCALLSKITGIPFIVLIPVMCFIKSKHSKTALFIFAALVLLTACYYAALISLLPGMARPYEYVETPLPYLNNISLKFGTAFYSLGYYVWLLFAPVQLSFYYGINYIELKNLFSLLPLISVTIYTALLAAAIYFWRKNVFVSFCLLFYLVQISLAANLVLPMPGIVGERVLLVASLPFCLLVSLLFSKAGYRPANKKKTNVSKGLLLFRNSYLSLALTGGLLLFYSYTTIARNADWKDTITLFEADMPHLANSAKANYMMAKEVRRLYRTDKNLSAEKLQTESAKAIHYYQQAINAYPQYALAMEELGTLYAVELRNISMAIPLFEKAFAIDSTLWRSANNLGMAYQMTKDTAMAIHWYEQSLLAKSGNVKVLEELAKLYYLKGEKQKALACNDSIMRLMPNSYLPYYNYAIYYMLEGDTASAVKYFEQDIARGEKEKFPFSFLIRHYLNQRDTANALRIRNLKPRFSH